MSEHVGMDEDPFERQQPEPDDADYDDSVVDEIMVNKTRPRGAIRRRTTCGMHIS